MDIQTNIAGLGEHGFAGMEAHSDTHRTVVGPAVSHERPLGCHRSADGIPRTLKGDQKTVALGVHLVSVSRFERVPKKPVVVGKRLRIACIAAVLKKERGPLVSVKRKVTVPLGAVMGR
jgi:hypothetical protein